MIPEYRPPQAYPEPEPENAGQPSEAHHKLLAAADAIIESQRDENRILSEALDEAWWLIRAQKEQVATLTEYADWQVERQTREYELRRVS